MPGHPPLHELNPLTRFNDRAQDYALYRPSYPATAIDAILNGLSDPTTLTAADIGAGTGISARLLGDRGVRVQAIEPNATMRASAAPHANVTFIEGTAEQTGLPDASVNLVTSFQAFHWFKPKPALTEFARILHRSDISISPSPLLPLSPSSTSGRLALVWNDRDPSDPFTAAYGAAIFVASGNHPGLHRSSIDLIAAEVTQSNEFRNVRVVEFLNPTRMSLDGLLGRSLSASYTPRSGTLHDALMNELKRLHAHYAAADGNVEMVYRTQMVLAETAR